MCEGVPSNEATTAAENATDASAILQYLDLTERRHFHHLTSGSAVTSLALPLIALHHEVKVIITFGSTLNGANYSLWCDYIYLDTDERRRFAQVSHEYLIEQVQHQSFSAGTTHDLVLNHQVKELIVAGPWSSGAFALAAGSVDDTMKLKLMDMIDLLQENGLTLVVLKF